MKECGEGGMIDGSLVKLDWFWKSVNEKIRVSVRVMEFIGLMEELIKIYGRNELVFGKRSLCVC